MTDNNKLADFDRLGKVVRGVVHDLPGDDSVKPVAVIMTLAEVLGLNRLDLMAVCQTADKMIVWSDSSMN